MGTENEITVDTKGMIKRLKDIDLTLENTKNVFSNVASVAQEVGAKLTNSITVPLVGLGNAALASSDIFQKASLTIRQGTGATGEALKGLEKDFKSVFKQMPEDAEKTSGVLAGLNSSLGLTGKPLQEMTKQMLNLSRVTGEDVNTLIADSSNIFGQWSIDTQNQSKTLDYLWKVSQSTGVGVGELTKKISESGQPLKQMGYSLEESAALFGKWESEGMDVQTAMDGMSIALDKMTEAGKNPAKEFPKLINQIKNAGSAGEANALAIDLFGSKIGNEMAQSIRDGKFNVEDLMSTLDNSKDSINSAGEETLTFGDRMEIFKNNTKTALKPLGDILLKIAEDWLPKVSSAIEKVSNWFSDLSPTTQNIIIALAGFAAAIGPILMIAAPLISILGALIGLAGTLGVSLGAIVAPIILVIAAIALLIAAVVAIVTNWSTISNTIKETFSLVVSSIVEKLSSLKESFVNTFNSIVEWIQTFIESSILFFTEGMNLVKEVIVNVLIGIRDFFINIFNSIVEWIQVFIETVKLIFTTGMDIVKMIFETVWNGIRDFFVNIIGGILEWIQGFIETMKVIFTIGLNIIKSIFETVWNGIKDFFVNVIGEIIVWIQGVMETMKVIFTTGLNIVKAIFTNVFISVKEVIIGIFNKIVGYFKTSFTLIKTIVQTIWNSLKSIIITSVTTIYTRVISGINLLKEGFILIFNSIKSRTVSIWNGIKNAIIDPIISAKDKVLSIITTIKDAFKNLLLKIPKPKIPKISMVSTKKSFLGFDIPIPNFDITWHKTGGIFSGPSIIGVGEQPGVKEAVIPMSGKHMRPFANEIANQMDYKQGGSYTVEVPVFLDGRQVAKVTAPYTAEELEKLRVRKNRGRGITI